MPSLIKTEKNTKEALRLKKILVTGANQGIGFQVAVQLAAKPNIHLFISSRQSWSESTRCQALEKIKSCLDPTSKLDAIEGLDLSSDESIDKVTSFIESKTSSLDCLVNNAAIGLYRKDSSSIRDMWSRTFETNCFGTVVLTEKLLPLLKASTELRGGKEKARIVNVSSDLGSLTRRQDPSYEYYGLPLTAYPASKTAINAYTVAMSTIHNDIIIMCVNPGYCVTNLSGFRGTQAASSGAEPILKGIFDPDVKSGSYFESQGPLDW